jgi:polyhydroxyalkanoate synthesis repressor PhaR
MPRTVKRYENRKLYDPESSSYISLARIADLVRAGETVVVLDNVTGEDLTVQTLTQVILEEGRQGRTLLSSDLLHDLLQRGGEAIGTGMSTLRHGVDDLVQTSMRRVQSFLQRPEEGELRDLREQLHRLEEMLHRMLDESERPSPDAPASAGPGDGEKETSS